MSPEFKPLDCVPSIFLDAIRAFGPCFLIKVNRYDAAPVFMRMCWARRCAVPVAAWQTAADIAGTAAADIGDDSGCVVTGTHGKPSRWFNALYRMPRSFTRFCILSFLLSEVCAQPEHARGHFLHKIDPANQVIPLASSANQVKPFASNAHLQIPKRSAPTTRRRVRTS